MNPSSVFTAHSSYALDVAFSVDGRTLISSGMDNVVKMWSAPDWQFLRVLEGHDKSVNSVALSPDGQTLATCSTDATAKLWSFPGGELRHTLRDRKKTVSAVRFSPDGQWLAASWYGGRATAWTTSGEEVVGIKASSKNLVAVAFVGDGRTLATAGLGDDILLWSLPSVDPAGGLTGHQTAVMALAPVREGSTLISLGYEQTIKHWDVQAQRERASYLLEGPPARGLAVSPDETLIAVAMEGQVQIRLLEDGSLQSELPISTKAVYGMAFSPDGRWLAAGAADGKIRVWEM